MGPSCAAWLLDGVSAGVGADRRCACCCELQVVLRAIVYGHKGVHWTAAAKGWEEAHATAEVLEVGRATLPSVSAVQEHRLGDGQACCHRGLLPGRGALASLMNCLSSVLCPPEVGVS